jgi:cyclic pyranopterin phosphate synthase
MKNSSTVLVDGFHRRLNYLRISLTDRCNLRCIYCMPPDGLSKLRHADILSYEEILRLAEIAVSLGVTKMRLTGGEPLVRKGIFDFIPLLTGLNGIEDVSLTTNGIFLKENLDKIKAGGIHRINVSLDTLKRQKYARMTGTDGLNTVLEGIKMAEQMGFHPIKINMVVIKGLNDDEVIDIARLSIDHPYQVRFIEYMPVQDPLLGGGFQHLPNDLLRERLCAVSELVEVEKGRHDGPAQRFKLKGAAGEIGFISPLSHHFCQFCNRLRLTANGKIRSCLLSNDEMDVRTPLREGASDHDLASLFIEAARHKPQRHGLCERPTAPFSVCMSAIGG